MNLGTGTFISMDSYQGSVYDPITLHKYLYANANPVMYTDPSGYESKEEQMIAVTNMAMIGTAILLAGCVALRAFSSVRNNMTSSVLDLDCTISVTDWKNVILGFPAHHFDNKWIVTIPTALLSAHLFEAIYATDEDVSSIPGISVKERDDNSPSDIPAQEKGDSSPSGIPARKQNGAKILQNNSNAKPSNVPYKNNKEANQQAQKQGYKDAHDLKASYVGKTNVAKFDMKHDTKTGQIYLESKDGKIQIPTSLFDK